METIELEINKVRNRKNNIEESKEGLEKWLSSEEPLLLFEGT